MKRRFTMGIEWLCEHKPWGCDECWGDRWMEETLDGNKRKALQREREGATRASDLKLGRSIIVSTKPMGDD